MINRKHLSGLLTRPDQWKKVIKGVTRMRGTAPMPGSSDHLAETVGFGPNPGALRMFTHLPRDLPDRCPLLVVLHGCTQSAAGYDLGAGWSTLADRFGFALLLPEQQRANNPNGCFNWYQPGDIERGQGEAASIRQMVATMIADHGIDPARVFITGLSAGGAMTSVMLATYPDVFAGGAIIAGLPYGAATNVQQAFENMYQCPPRSARAWGDLVRRASRHKDAWPRISVWHGGADATVIPANAAEIIKQWTNLHGLPDRSSFETVVDGYPRQVWTNAAGEEVIESFTIPGMAHGTPLATGSADTQCGAAGPFLLEVGISSSYHIAGFFGLADTRRPSQTTDRRLHPSLSKELHKEEVLQTAASEPLEGEILGPEVRRDAKHSPPDIGAIITNALRTAGLMKGG